MQRALPFLAVAFAINLSATGHSAQTEPTSRPSFAGRWILISASGARYAKVGDEATIAQDQSSLTVGAVRYPLESSESQSLSTRNWGTLTSVTQPKWADNVLTITTADNVGATSHWEDLAIYSLDRVGNLNVVRMSHTIELSQRDFWVEPWTATSLVVYKRS
jgi:hypothetical protein